MVITKIKQIIKIFILIEIQVAFIFIVLIFIKQSEVEKKVFNTNKFIYELLIDKQFEELKKVDENDIVIGEKYAPATLFVYFRYGCSACSQFFKIVYPKLQEEYIQSGQLKIVVRQKVQTSRPIILHAAQASIAAYRADCFDEFNNSIHLLDGSLSNNIVDNIALNLTNQTQEEFDKFMSDQEITQMLLDKANDAIAVGITATPTFIIGNEQIVGTRPLRRFEALIEESLNTNNNCE